LGYLNTIYSLWAIAIAIIIITLFVTYYTTKKAIDPLSYMQDDLLRFFDFLSHKNGTIEPFKVYYNDEIGSMVKILNENVQNISKGIIDDKNTISQSADICTIASKGTLDVKIESIANSEDVNNLTGIVNQLLNSTNRNISSALQVLNGYSNNNFNIKIKVSDELTGQLRDLFNQVNTLGDKLVELGSANLKNGLSIQQTVTIFKKNLENVLSSAQIQATSIENTVNSLNDITKNIQDTTNNAIQMANYSKEVIKSSNDGEVLATKTSESMDEIAIKVNSISEAIEAIDQIAFQTNILSLNAAVEAATAGEAGKGFAVVAGEVRNLASKSAESANDIKSIVEIALEQTNQGKDVAAKMIDGYNILNDNIKSTTTLIDTVAKDSELQKQKIEQINSEMSILDKEILNNKKIIEETDIAASQTYDLANKIVKDSSSQDLGDTSGIKVRKKLIDPNYSGPERRKIEKSMKH
jgi:methyl-accepting chemotaxis protein